ncbi:Cthe_2314 family HEPN domain-containing protein [Gaetbulibacter sp. M235]|uniref:Cthe_2314 family HEPN domain-containing protein n=1 Tax=Gaetbulibacter sp. M235 TaxID=3126510 RepID=UPI00374FC7D8
MTEKEKYINNPFTINLLYSTSVIINDLSKKPGFKYGQNNYHLLNIYEKYLSDVGKINSELRSVFEQIDFISIFLRRFPSKKFYHENGIGELEYIQYHTEVLFHKVHTISEIMKLLVNEVYCLGIERKDCNWKRLNQKLPKETPCLAQIENYHETFKEYIDYRHLNTHRGIYIDDEKDSIENEYGLGIYLIAKSLNYELGDDFKKAFPKVLIDYKIKILKKERIKFLCEIQNKINKSLKSFLTTLNEEFDSKKNVLKHRV